MTKNGTRWVSLFRAGTASPQCLIVGAGVMLAVCTFVLRIVILREELAALDGADAGLVALWGIRQDLMLALIAILSALLLWLVFPGQRAKRWVAIGFLALCTLILLWSSANVLVVGILGEPVSLSWLLYADLFNSTYAYEAILSFVNLGLILALIAGLVAYWVFSLLAAALFARVRRRVWPTVLVSIASTTVLVALPAASTDRSVDAGKLANPIIAFTFSLFEQDRVIPGFAVANAGPEVAASPPIRTALPLGKPYVPDGQIRNVVYFVMESLAAKYTDGFLGTYGATPNILKHSATGQRFTNIYAHAPASNYSLVSLMAALVPELSRYSMTYSYPELKLDTISRELRDRGYRTGFFSSTDNRFQDTVGFVTRAGFETVRDHNDWPCEFGVYEAHADPEDYLDSANDKCTVKPVVDWIEENPDLPFFATIWTGMTHYPYFPGEAPRHYTDEGDLNRYLNAARVGDEALGMLLDYLAERDLADSTLVVVVGDHGEAFGEHGNYVHARAIFQENLHVPLMLINPVILDGGTAPVIGGLSDIAPTVFDLMGLSAPETWQGLSLYDARPDGVLFFTPWNGFQIGYREGDLKFIYNANSEESLLFDLGSDPDERTNLATADSPRLDRAKEVLSDWVSLQRVWTDALLEGTFERPRATQGPGRNEITVYATGTSYLTAPRAEVRIDDVIVGQFEVGLAPSTASAPVTEDAIDGAITAFRIQFEPQACSRRLEVHFLNDEWAGNDKPGDTDLYIQSLEINGRRYWPTEFTLETAGAGGQSRFYYQFYRNGVISIDLDVAPDCISGAIAASNSGELQP